MEQTSPILEAERQILSDKAGKDGDFYTNKKYIKIAGHTAWCGVLVALDAVLKVRENLKNGQRPDIKDYQEAIGKFDKKMPRLLMNSYDTLHKTLGYDGNLRFKIVQDGLEEAQEIISWAGKYYTH